MTVAWSFFPHGPAQWIAFALGAFGVLVYYEYVHRR